MKYERQKSLVRKENARARMKTEKIKPLFDCLFCSQEHFVLDKISQTLLTASCFPMQNTAYKIVQ